MTAIILANKTLNPHIHLIYRFLYEMSTYFQGNFMQSFHFLMKLVPIANAKIHEHDEVLYQYSSRSYKDITSIEQNFTFPSPFANTRKISHPGLQKLLQTEPQFFKRLFYQILLNKKKNAPCGYRGAHLNFQKTIFSKQNNYVLYQTVLLRTGTLFYMGNVIISKFKK